MNGIATRVEEFSSASYRYVGTVGTYTAIKEFSIEEKKKVQKNCYEIFTAK